VRCICFAATSIAPGNIHPAALELLASRTHRLDHLRSKSWDEFTRPAAPSPDWIITLCDSAAAMPCPVFPGAAEKRHWGLPDPASGAISFDDCRQDIEERIHAFLDELREQP